MAFLLHPMALMPPLPRRTNFTIAHCNNVTLGDIKSNSKESLNRSTDVQRVLSAHSTWDPSGG